MRLFWTLNANFDTATVIERVKANPNGWDVYVYFDGSNGTETRVKAVTSSAAPASPRPRFWH